jgi:exodeoxyribonuclease VII large subunit
VRDLGARLGDAATGQVDAARERLAVAGVAIARAATRPVERRRLILEGIAGRLHALSPLATLGRGYAVLSKEDGSAVSQASDLVPGDAFVARLRDGRVRARAEQIESTGDTE